MSNKSDDSNNEPTQESAPQQDSQLSPELFAQFMRFMQTSGMVQQSPIAQPQATQQAKKGPTRGGRATRSFQYRDLTFFVSFDGDLALVSVQDPKTKQPSLRARVNRSSYMKAVQAIAKSVLAEGELRLLEAASKRKA